VKTRVVGDLQSELVEDFFEGFAAAVRGANVHLKTLYGRSNHHKVEALFKAFRGARALRCGMLARQATWRDAAEHQGPSCDRSHRLQGRQSDFGDEGADRARSYGPRSLKIPPSVRAA